MKIVGVSDVSVGHGSPQILALMKSLIQRYPGAEAHILEPDQSNIAPYEDPEVQLKALRMDTAFDAYSGLGRREYCVNAAKKVNQLNPDILIIFCTFCLPVLFKLKKKPGFVIYYHLEYAPFYGGFDIQMNQVVGNRVDMVIHPEANRATFDIGLCGYKDVPLVTAYNCAGLRKDIQITPATQRNNKILYQGSISRQLTFADYYVDKRLSGIPIDLYGNITGDDRIGVESSFHNSRNDIRYHGYLDSQELAVMRKEYAYSIVMWNPVNENFYYACPNKFFESIYDGVPPIAAPHPQCKAIIEQYECGIVMQDWSFESFRLALSKAIDMYGTSEYMRMVENCREAAQSELNWDEQFAKIERHLKSR